MPASFEPQASTPGPRWRVYICEGPNCSARGSQALADRLEDEVARAGLQHDVTITRCLCRGRCDDAPSMNVFPGPVFYNWLTAEAITQIVIQHLAGSEPVDEWRYLPPAINLDGLW